MLLVKKEEELCWAASHSPVRPILAWLQDQQPKVSNRDISGLMDGRTYTFETRSWSVCGGWQAGLGGSLLPETGGGYQL